jgi:hypothetical protein
MDILLRDTLNIYMHAYTYIKSVPEISAVNWRVSTVARKNENTLYKNREGDNSKYSFTTSTLNSSFLHKRP